MRCLMGKSRTAELCCDGPYPTDPLADCWAYPVAAGDRRAWGCGVMDGDFVDPFAPTAPITPAATVPDYMTVYPEMDQGSEEWLAARCGVLTASEVKLIMTPTGNVAYNDKTRAHVWELAAQRITQFVEPRYIGDDMLRGHEDEVYARMAYDQHIAPTQTMGFMVNRKWGFAMGFSPDWLVGDDGLGEAKSRIQRFQVQTICDHVSPASCPPDYVLQCQTGLLVSERKWLDLCSYSNGLHMAVIRIHPDPVLQDLIIEAATVFEEKVRDKITDYHAALASGARLIPTERRIREELY